MKTGLFWGICENVLLESIVAELRTDSVSTISADV